MLARSRAQVRRAVPGVLVDKALVVVAFVLATGPFEPAFTGPRTLGALDPAQLVLTGAILVALFRFGPRVALLDWRLREDPWLFGILVLSTASAAWSLAPGVTLLRAAGLVLGTAFGLYLGVRFTLREIVELLAIALAGVLAASLMVSLVRPDLGVETAWALEGSWNGVYDHKNLLGRSATLGVVVALALFVYTAWRRWAVCGLLAVSGVALVMSQSVTSWVALLGCVGAAVLGRYLRWDRRFFTMAAIAGGLLLTVAMLVPQASTTHVFGRDLTLTGRTEVWAIVVDHIGERPALGYGFGAYWRGLDGPSEAVWVQAWDAHDAHNGYFDLLLHVGLLGGAPFAAMLVRHGQWALAHLRRRDVDYALLPLVIGVFVLLMNLSESTFLRPTNLHWFVYIAVIHRAGLELSGAPQPTADEAETALEQG